MKVLFMFSGLPHYYNLILNRLNNIPDLEIVVVAPATASGSTLGKGVYQSKKGIEFKVHFLEQQKALYKFKFKGFTKVLEIEKPDIVVTTFYYAFHFLYDLSTKRIFRKNNIKLLYKDIPFGLPKYEDATLHHAKILGYQEDSFFIKKWALKFAGNSFKHISKLLYSKMDGFVNYVEKAYEIFGSYGVPKEKIFITYNSIDTEILAKTRAEVEKLPAILPENPYRIFHIGRIVEWKRVDLLINAVHQLKKGFPKIELLVIGNGPLLEEYKLLAKKLQVENHIQFLGAIYDQVELGRYFQSCSAYVLAGMGGLSINETMAYGLPVICSVCDGTEKHLVYDDYNGKYFKNGDLADLTEKIKFILENPAKAREMGKHSEKIIRDKINVHTVINGYVRAFNAVSNNKHQLSYTFKGKELQGA